MGQKQVDKNEAKNYLPELSLYASMAHYVAKVLHQRPNDILDKWGVPELIVAYGQYANEEAEKNYQEWKHLPTEARAKTEKPQRFAVRFYNGEQSGD